MGWSERGRGERTPEQIAAAVLEYYRLGIHSFLLRGFENPHDTMAIGRDLIPLIKAGALEIDFSIDFTDAAIGHQHKRLSMANGSFVRELSEAGLTDIETWSYDHQVSYTHAGWRGRIRASQGVGATLSPQQVVAFDAELARLLQTEFPADPMPVPHRVWVVHGRKR